MDARTLETLKSQWRQFVAERIGDAINDLKTHVPEFSRKYNALILLESRLNDANLKNIQNIISDEALQVQYNQIRADLLLFISALEVQDFELPASASQGKSGALLYKIPKEMQLAVETKCLVRLAFDKPTIIKNIELTEEVEIRDVRVTEVMQVELIDPSIEQPFHIRSFSDEEQFVEKEAYTEWIFYVKPMKAGTFPLMLKVSVVEKVQGKDRVRNIVWEEQVQITATEPEQAEAILRDLAEDRFEAVWVVSADLPGDRRRLEALGRALPPAARAAAREPSVGAGSEGTGGEEAGSRAPEDRPAGEAEARGVVAVDLLGPLIKKVAQRLHVEPRHQPGLLHGFSDDYFRRVEAVEFAVRHDDGANLHTLHEADLVLTGVSRTSKTPLSMYLAQRGYKTGNVPLIPGLEPPKELLELSSWRVFGLTVDPGTLLSVRSARLRTMKAPSSTSYIDPDQVMLELDRARRLFRAHGWRMIDVSRRAVEENASRIIEIFALSDVPDERRSPV